MKPCKDVFLRVLIVSLELLHCKTAALRTPINAEHLLLAARTFIPFFAAFFFPQLGTHQVIYIFSVFQLGFDPRTQNHFFSRQKGGQGCA